jgi:hypothetical protein
MFNYFPPPPENHTLLKKFCTVGQATDGHMTHARCMLDTQGYKHTLRICNIYCFTAAKMVSRNRLNVRFIRAFLITVWPFRNEGSQMRHLASSYFSVYAHYRSIAMERIVIKFNNIGGFYKDSCGRISILVKIERNDSR